MVMEYIHGQMAESIMDNTLKIKNKVKEHYLGQMVKNTKEAGKMEFKAAMVNSQPQKNKKERVNGKTVKESHGLVKLYQKIRNEILIFYYNIEIIKA